MSTIETQTFSQHKKGHLKFQSLGDIPRLHLAIEKWGLRSSGACMLVCWRSWDRVFQPCAFYKRETRFRKLPYSHVGWWWSNRAPYSQEYWQRAEKANGWFRPTPAFDRMVAVIGRDENWSPAAGSPRLTSN